MQEVLKQYGRVFLSGITLAMVLYLIFAGITDEENHHGIRAILGARIETEGINYQGYSDFDAYHAETEKAAPQIVYQDNGYLTVGTVDFLANINATDYAGNVLLNAGDMVDETEKSRGYIKIVKVEDLYQNDLSSCINRNTGEISFLQRGIYRITMCAQDKVYRRSTVIIQVPVM